MGRLMSARPYESDPGHSLDESGHRPRGSLRPAGTTGWASATSVGVVAREMATATVTGKKVLTSHSCWTRMSLVKLATSVTSSAAVALVPATPGHFEEVAALWQAAWGDGHRGHVPDGLLPHRTPGAFRRRTAYRLDAMTVAVDREGAGSSVVGFHVVNGAEVEQLYVSAHWRGTGVATTLLTDAERTIATRHATAWLAVAPGNARARRFYERCGWQDAGDFDNPADTQDGVVLVPTRRYEKRVRSQKEHAR